MRTTCICICFRKKICRLYDIMTSGTYFWNTVKNRIFFGKSVPFGCTYFLRQFYFTGYKQSLCTFCKIVLVRYDRLSFKNATLKIGFLSCDAMTNRFKQQLRRENVASQNKHYTQKFFSGWIKYYFFNIETRNKNFQ